MITYKQLTLAEIFEYRTKISFCTIGEILRIVDEDKSMKQKFEEKRNQSIRNTMFIMRAFFVMIFAQDV